MPTPPRYREQVRQRIVQSATLLFNRHGFPAALCRDRAHAKRFCSRRSNRVDENDVGAGREHPRELLQIGGIGDRAGAARPALPRNHQIRADAIRERDSAQQAVQCLRPHQPIGGEAGGQYGHCVDATRHGVAPDKVSGVVSREGGVGDEDAKEGESAPEKPKE